MDLNLFNYINQINQNRQKPLYYRRSKLEKVNNRLQHCQGRVINLAAELRESESSPRHEALKTEPARKLGADKKYEGAEVDCVHWTNIHVGISRTCVWGKKKNIYI